MLAFIDTLRAEGHTVESILRVLQEQGVQIAARTYRAWKKGRVSARTITDARVVDAVRDLVWATVTLPDGTRKRKMTPEGLYGRRKMTALVRRVKLPDAPWGAVDRVCGSSASRGRVGRKGCAPRSSRRTASGPLTCWIVISPRPAPITPG